MKKSAILLAGLFLVSGTVFAGDLDFSGTQVKVKTKLITTDTKSVNDDSNGDTDVILQMNYKIDDKTSASFKFNTDDNSDSASDDVLAVKVKRVDGPIEAQFRTDLSFANSVSAVGDVIDFKSVSFKEVQDSRKDSAETYVKWNKSSDLSFTAYPFNMGMHNGTMYDKDKQFTAVPGLVANYKTSYVGLGYDTLSDNKNTILGIKAGYKLALGSATVNAKYSGIFYDEDKVVIGSAGAKVGNAATINKITQDVNVNINYKLNSKITLDAEAGYNKLNKNTTIQGSKDDTGYALTAKATIKMSDALAPYAQFKYSTDGYLAYGDMNDVNFVYSNLKTGGITEAIAGVNYTLTKGLVLNTEAKLKSAGEKIYKNTDAVSYKEKQAFQLTASVAYKF